MMFGHPKTEEERVRMHRSLYEHEKEEIIDFLKSRGSSEEEIAVAITNSLLVSFFEELAKDGYISKEELEKLSCMDYDQRSEYVEQRRAKHKNN